MTLKLHLCFCIQHLFVAKIKVSVKASTHNKVHQIKNQRNLCVVCSKFNLMSNCNFYVLLIIIIICKIKLMNIKKTKEKTRKVYYIC